MTIETPQTPRPKARPNKRRIAIAAALFSSCVAAAMLVRVVAHQNGFSFLLLMLGVICFLMLMTRGGQRPEAEPETTQTNTQDQTYTQETSGK